MAETLPSEQAWSIDPDGFPCHGVRRASSWPSSSATRCWRRPATTRSLGASFLSDTHVDVVADTSRALHMVDPHDREMIMSCAAAAETLLGALRAFGLTGTLMPTAAAARARRHRPHHAVARAGLGRHRPPDARCHRQPAHGAPRLRRDRGAGRGADADARGGAPVRGRAQPVRGHGHARCGRRAGRRCRPHPVRRPGVPRRARLLDAPADLAGRRRPRRPRLRFSRLGDAGRRRR